jgi:LTXXQ motif family protein
MKKTIGILATTVAVCALCIVTDLPAIAAGGGHGGGFGGGGGHGGGFGGGGGHGGAFGGFAAHVGGGHGGGLGGFHGFAAHGGGHGLSAHGFSTHAFHGHGISSHTMSGSHHVAGHNISHGHAVTGNAGRIAGHGVANTGHNALATHNQLNDARNQFAHNQLSHNQFAHNQFAAQNFHGLNNFNHTGFNRNAFGNNANWNHWGGHFWGAGWNNWGWGWGGWAGPVFWPFLLGDVLSFVFWPYDYYDPFWWYGPPFIWASIFAPGPYFGIDYGYGPDYYGYGYGPDYYGYVGSPNIYYDSSRGVRTGYAKTEQADREALAETNTAALESCTGLAPGVTNLPIDQIRRTVHPTADQEAALDNLSAASSQASEVIKSSCPSAVPLTPIGRLDAAEQRLQATIKAIQIVRAPLERFYQALNDEQRQRFNAMNGSSERAPSGANMAAACSQQATTFIDLPVQRIEQVIQPTTQQQSAFDDLKKTAQNASEQLQSSCTTAVPLSPVARVDTVETRLNAMADAIKSVRPDLNNFYASLSDEQKARFNTMGPPPNAASSPQQRQSGGQR